MKQNKKMGKKYKRKAGDVYWQTAGYNAQLFESFRTQIINLALSRFKWLNLPATCDERFLEWTLLVNGVATIARPKSVDAFFSTQAATLGFFNVYDNPTSWESFGNNGWRFKCNADNGVLIFDNLARQPLLPILDIYARELVDVIRTKQLNRQHQKIPFLITGPESKQLDMLNLYKQVDGGEPAVLADDGISAVQFQALKTDVEFIGDKLQEEFENVWKMIYTALGIRNMDAKGERQSIQEVQAISEPTEMNALSPLQSRRQACEKLNERFEPFISEPINVVWRQDFISDNYNYMNNIMEQEGADDGGI